MTSKILARSRDSSSTINDDAASILNAKKSCTPTSSSFPFANYWTYELDEADVLKQVFSFLDMRSLNAICIVCKEWNNIVTKSHLKAILRLRIELEQRNISLPVHIISQILKLSKHSEPAAFDLLCDYAIFREKEITKFVTSSTKGSASSSLSSSSIESAIKQQRLTYKVYWSKHDKQNRPCIVLRPALHVSDKRNTALLFSLNMFEIACERIWKINLRVKDFAVIMDFQGFGKKNFDLNFARTFIGWSRKYFKNLLGICYTIRSPIYGLWCWNIVKLLVPAETLKKIVIVPSSEWRKVLADNFDPECLPIEYGGKLQLPPRVKLSYSPSTSE